MKRNYYWLLAVTLFLQQFLMGGILNNLSSLFTIPVTQSMDISRSCFALAVSTRGLVAFGSTFFSGFFNPL